jgi:cysteinyl-tRNA synthetase
LQLIDEVADKALRADVCGACLDTITEQIKDVLGIDIAVTNITPEQERLILERETVRASKDWAQSDVLRNELIEQGIGLRDTQTGAIWYRL